MKFINANNGVKKLFTAEIFIVIASLFGLASSLLYLVAYDSISSEEDYYHYLIGIIILGIIGVALVVAGVIFQLFGLNQARKDEKAFKKALFFLFICIGSTVVILFTGRGMFNNIFSGINETATLLVDIYIIMGVFSLANQMDRNDVQSRGKVTLIGLVAVFVLSVIVRFFGIFVDDGDVLYSIIGVVCSALEVLVYLIFLTYLSMAKKMLSKQ